MSRIGTGTSGTILQGAGAGVSPKYSTATYPATAGTSGNALTSNGTNFTSSAYTVTGDLLLATTTLTSAQIKALKATPIECIAAPGSGNIIVVQSVLTKLVYGGSNVFTNGQSCSLLYNGTTSVCTDVITAAQVVFSTNSTHSTTYPLSFSAASSSLENQNIKIANVGASEITGNAAGDNTVNVYIYYTIVAI